MSDNLRGLMRSTDPKAIELWDRICTEYDNAQDRARAYLRSIGVKLAHPDDGWVKRRPDGSGSFHRSWYPLFDDRPEVGDLIAFGSPPEGEHYRSWHDVWRGRKDSYAREQMKRLKGQPESSANGYRICRVTKVERRASVLGYMQHFEFAATGETWPPVRPTTLGRLRRLIGARSSR